MPEWEMPCLKCWCTCVVRLKFGERAFSVAARPLSGTDYRVTFGISAALPYSRRNWKHTCSLLLIPDAILYLQSQFILFYFILFYFSIVLYLRLRSSCIWRTIQITVLLLLSWSLTWTLPVQKWCLFAQVTYSATGHGEKISTSCQRHL